MNNLNAKEEIIVFTINLIKKYQGNLEKVTIREIASLGNWSVGLINYHFKNKENLIKICVNKIIEGVVFNYCPNMSNEDNKTAIENATFRLKKAGKEIFEFFFKNKEIVKVSILGDYNEYRDSTNSFFSVCGFSNIISKGINDKNKKDLIAFIFGSLIQTAFLKSYENNKFLDFDFGKKEERNRYIDQIVDILME